LKGPKGIPEMKIIAKFNNEAQWSMKQQDFIFFCWNCA
jgi:hypothetical protein